MGSLNGKEEQHGCVCVCNTRRQRLIKKKYQEAMYRFKCALCNPRCMLKWRNSPVATRQHAPRRPLSFRQLLKAMCSESDGKVGNMLRWQKCTSAPPQCYATKATLRWQHRQHALQMATCPCFPHSLHSPNQHHHHRSSAS